MSDRVRTVKLEAPSLGLNSTDSPGAVGSTQAPTVTNYLTGERGRTQHRGQIWDKDLVHNLGGVVTPSAKRPIAFAGNSSSARIGFKNPSASRWQEPWDARFEGISAQLAEAEGEVWSQGITVSGTSTAIAKQHVPGWKHVVWGGYVYAICYDSVNNTAAAADGIVANDLGAFERHRRITRGLTSYVYMPRAAVDLAVHYTRLMTLGGSDPDPAVSLTPQTNTIWYTRVLTTTDYASGINAADAAATIWTDEVTGARNRMALLEWQGDRAVAWAAVGRDRAIFGRRSIQVLYGFGPDTWNLRLISTNVGCVDPQSVVETDVGAFFMSHEGFMHFDGARVTNVSRQVNRTLVPAVMQRRGSIPTTISEAGGYVLASPVTRDHILVTVGTQPWASPWGDPTLDFCMLFHIPSGTWTNLSSSLWAAGGPLAQAGMRDGAMIWHRDDISILRGRVWDSAAFASHFVDITNPASSTETNRGRDGETTWAAGVPTNTVTYTALPTEWKSRIVELVGPPHAARLRRVLIDYEWVRDGDATDDLASGPTVTLYDGTGTQLDSFALPSQADVASPPYRRRYVRQVYAECTDLQVKISTAGQNSVGIRDHAVHGVWVEFVEAEQRE